VSFIKPGILFIVIWMGLFILSFCSGCATKKEVGRIDYLMKSNNYIIEGNFCQLEYKFCLLAADVYHSGTNRGCFKEQEKCEIRSFKKFRAVTKK